MCQLAPTKPEQPPPAVEPEGQDEADDIGDTEDLQNGDPEKPKVDPEETSL